VHQLTARSGKQPARSYCLIVKRVVAVVICLGVKHPQAGGGGDDCSAHPTVLRPTTPIVTEQSAGCASRAVAMPRTQLS
jgi:hypothetical protein